MNTPFDDMSPEDVTNMSREELERGYQQLLNQGRRLKWEADCYKLAWKFRIWSILMRASRNLRTPKGHAGTMRKQRTRTRLKRTLGKVQDAVMNHGFND